MTMRSEFILECICGHIGKIKMSENDQPSSKMWERYTLENFNGNSYYCEGITVVGVHSRNGKNRTLRDFKIHETILKTPICLPVVLMA
jgi:hypothetical protein